MNIHNYASLEASKKLFDAGIVLETEKYWIETIDGWELCSDDDEGAIPAPMFTEVWRELQSRSEQPQLAANNKHTVAFIGMDSPDFGSENPTDALIDLLIWVRKEK